MKNPVVICFGEILWDILPSGKIAGGAPMNVAYQIQNMGLNAHMISRVGSDALGEALLTFLEGKGVSTDLVQTDTAYPTGVVHVQLDDMGIATYDIVQPAAWDYITLHDDVLQSVRNADALVFGSLSCRAEISRNTLLTLVEAAPLRVFDVNLRAPFYDQVLLESLLSKAHIVKVNDLELDELSSWYQITGSELEKMTGLCTRFGIERLIVTKGAHGASCLSKQGFCSVPGLSVKVQDTVGSGDAFLAGFLRVHLLGEDDFACLMFANGLGALTATKAGGTPVILAEELALL